MIPGMNSRQAAQMMKKMGIAQQEINAVEVIIRCEDKNIVIANPQVSKVNMMGQDMLFVTNLGRNPQVIPLQGLSNAKVVTEKDFERGGKLDMSPVMPYGPMGKGIMFVGASLQIDLLDAGHFVSLNRDAQTGSLDLETVMTMAPFKMNNIEAAEFDFPSYYTSAKNK